ncbi:toxin glutamine deamidase domain-containing protein [Streptomyces sp. NPDC048611]|uniref:toxin glutamine deamidase domain-containing protein n=1 Tax=Streptomyces sp. NPDC048611 TaxID=3155635 RepID=UPI00343F65D5
MSLNPPDALEWVLDMLGFNWPHADEDKMMECAQAWRDFAAEVAEHQSRGNTYASNVLGENSGDAIEGFNKAWEKFAGNSGYLNDAAQAAEVIAATFEAAAVLVIGMKVAVIVQLAILAAEIIAAQVAAPFTLGLSEIGGAAATLATREVVRRILKEVAQQLLQAIMEAAKEPVISALQAMASDLIAQTVNQNFGAQKGYDLGRTAKEGEKAATDALKNTGETLGESLRDGAGSRAGRRARGGLDSAAGHGSEDGGDSSDSGSDGGSGSSSSRSRSGSGGSDSGSGSSGSDGGGSGSSSGSGGSDSGSGSGSDGGSGGSGSVGGDSGSNSASGSSAGSDGGGSGSTAGDSSGSGNRGGSDTGGSTSHSPRASDNLSAGTGTDGGNGSGTHADSGSDAGAGNDPGPGASSDGSSSRPEAQPLPPQDQRSPFDEGYAGGNDNPYGTSPTPDGTSTPDADTSRPDPDSISTQPAPDNTPDGARSDADNISTQPAQDTTPDAVHPDPAPDHVTTQPAPDNSPDGARPAPAADTTPDAARPDAPHASGPSPDAAQPTPAPSPTPDPVAGNPPSTGDSSTASPDGYSNNNSTDSGDNSTTGSGGRPSMPHAGPPPQGAPVQHSPSSGQPIQQRDPAPGDPMPTVDDTTVTTQSAGTATMPPPTQHTADTGTPTTPTPPQQATQPHTPQANGPMMTGAIPPQPGPTTAPPRSTTPPSNSTGGGNGASRNTNRTSNGNGNGNTSPRPNRRPDGSQAIQDHTQQPTSDRPAYNPRLDGPRRDNPTTPPGDNRRPDGSQTVHDHTQQPTPTRSDRAQAEASQQAQAPSAPHQNQQQQTTQQQQPQHQAQPTLHSNTPTQQQATQQQSPQQHQPQNNQQQQHPAPHQQQTPDQQPESQHQNPSQQQPTPEQQAPVAQPPNLQSHTDVRIGLNVQPNGLYSPFPYDQQALEASFPRNPDGTPRAFNDPFQPWAQLQNDGGPTVLGRSNNCADCTRSFMESWYGNPQVSAVRTYDPDGKGGIDRASGERDGTRNIEQYTGATFRNSGPNSQDGYSRIADDLRAAGPGAAAAVLVTWPDRPDGSSGGAHVFNAVNHNGTVVWVDSQTGMVSDQPINTQAKGVWHLVLDANRQPFDPATAQSQPQNHQQSQPQQHAQAQAHAQQQAQAQAQQHQQSQYAQQQPSPYTQPPHQQPPNNNPYLQPSPQNPPHPAGPEGVSGSPATPDSARPNDSARPDAGDTAPRPDTEPHRTTQTPDSDVQEPAEPGASVDHSDNDDADHSSRPEGTPQDHEADASSPDSEEQNDTDTPPSGQPPADTGDYHQPSFEGIRHELLEGEGGLVLPDPHDQQALEDAVPRDEDGYFQRFPDPYGDWADLQNDGGQSVPGRDDNCADCSRSYLETWYGNPQVSAPRMQDGDFGERDGEDNIQRWLGAEFQHAGDDALAYSRVAEDLRNAGHGAAAIVWVGYVDSDGDPFSSHLFNAVNYHGSVVWVDTQSREVMNRPINTADVGEVWHLPLDAEAQPLYPPSDSESEASEPGAERDDAASYPAPGGHREQDLPSDPSDHHDADPSHDVPAPAPDSQPEPSHPASDSRPRTEPGGIVDPDPEHQRDLENRIPRTPEGTVQRHPDPNQGNWTDFINQPGADSPGRSNNCVDVALSTADTYAGAPSAAGARTPDFTADGVASDRGETGGRDRMENSLGARFTDFGNGRQAFQGIENALRQSGHGSQAVIVTQHSDRRAHAWNVVNHNGKITYIDAQTGRRSDKPLHSGEHGVFAVPLDSNRKPLQLAPSAGTSEQHNRHSSSSAQTGRRPSENPAGTDEGSPEQDGQVQPKSKYREPGMPDGQPINHLPENVRVLPDEGQQLLRDNLDVYETDMQAVYDSVRDWVDDGSIEALIQHLTPDEAESPSEEGDSTPEDGAAEGASKKPPRFTLTSEELGQRLDGFADMDAGQRGAVVSIIARLSLSFHESHAVGVSPYPVERPYKWEDNPQRPAPLRRDARRQTNDAKSAEEEDSRGVKQHRKANFLEAKDFAGNVRKHLLAELVDAGRPASDLKSASEGDGASNTRPDFSGRNYAVIEVYDPQSEKTNYIVDSSIPPGEKGVSTAHSEPHLVGYVKRLNEARGTDTSQHIQIRAMFTEREPCGTVKGAGHAECSPYLVQHSDGTTVHYATTYRSGQWVADPDPNGIQTRTKAQIKAMVDAEFQGHLNEVGEIWLSLRDAQRKNGTGTDD